jgi:DNA-binding PadR family transcriptional regulator
MVKGGELNSTEEGKKRNLREFDAKNHVLWASITKNYEMIEGAQLSNSFIILKALDQATEALSTTEISKMIAEFSGGRIYKVASTLKDSLEYRLKREGYVKGVIATNKILYSITPKGKTLLNGWIAFIKAID